MSGPLNPSEKTVSERDYEKKFNSRSRSILSSALNELRRNEQSSDVEWLKNRKASAGDSTPTNGEPKKKRKLQFALPKSGKMKRGSAFLFLFGLIVGGVWYTSVLAPNILLVNTKEIYTNDLADATTALQIYTQISYLNKIGAGSLIGQQACKESTQPVEQPIKCRLSTFSRYEKLAFERQGWTVIPGKQYGDDKRDDQDMNNDTPIEARFQVAALLAPNYKEAIAEAIANGITSVEKVLEKVGSENTTLKKSELQTKKREAEAKGDTVMANYYESLITQLDSSTGNVDAVGNLLKSPEFSQLFPNKETLESMFNELMNPDEVLGYVPIVSGPQLWLYSQLSAKAKEQVWGVFNPRSSFFHDARFVERLKSRYNMSKAVTVGGNSEAAVNNSFDTSVGVLGGGIEPFTGQSDPTYGTSLAALSTPLTKNALPDLVDDTVGLVGNIFTQPINTSNLQNLISPEDFKDISSKGPAELLSDFGEKAGLVFPALSDLEKIINKQLPFPLKLQVAANVLALNSYSYTDLMCSWYTVGKISSNALIRAKASTAARYALQYLKAADSIKAGTAQEVATNELAGKLAQDKKLNPFNPNKEYGGGLSATDSLIYRMTAYGDFIPGLGDIATGLGALNDVERYPTDPLPLLGGFFNQFTGTAMEMLSIVTYNLSAYESIATMAASWAQVLPNAAAFGGISGASADGGVLLPPPIDLAGLDRKYCLSGETILNKNSIKGLTTNDTKCAEAVLAMAPIGMQAALAEVAELARRTCPPTNPVDDNPIRILYGDWRGPIQYVMWPSKLIVQATMTPYVAAWFGVNTMLAAAATQLLYTSQVTGFDANYALFSGMGELLGDMAMSRGLMPSNPIDMAAYLHLGELLAVKDGKDDLAKASGKKNPFDPYNKFSFIGSLVRSLPQFTSKETPVIATINNALGTIAGSVRQVAAPQKAGAFYFSQPNLLTFDGDMVERELQYAARVSSAFCPVDFEAISITITPDIMCNVRYSMPFDDLAKAIDLNGLIDYMTAPHPELYDAKLQDFPLERFVLADKDIEYPTGLLDVAGALPWLSQWKGPLPASNKTSDLVAQLTQILDVRNKPMIDENGKVTPGSEYDKYLTYCVNRLDPWGRSAVAARYKDADRDPVDYLNIDNNLDPYTPSSGPPPYAKAPDLGQFAPRVAVTATQDDLDWYTGKNCTRLNPRYEMMQYFRAYTTLCSVDGSMSGKVDCADSDYSRGAYSNRFYLNNDILFTSWY